MKIQNRYEIHILLEGGFTQRKHTTNTLKFAKTVCRSIIEPTIIIDTCKNKHIKP